MKLTLAWGFTLIAGLGGCLGATTSSVAPEDRAPGSWETLGRSNVLEVFEP